MPTGYTSDIYNGELVDAKNFIMSCARSFGALASMRDEPLNVEIPTFLPREYHLTERNNAELRLEKYMSMSIEEANRLAEKIYRSQTDDYIETIKKKSALKNRYESLLNQVKLWNPPTANHEGLKEFCIKQLEESIRFDCNTRYLVVPEIQSGEEYLAFKIQSAKEDIEYHTNKYKEEVKRTNEKNDWVRQLKESL